MYPKKIFYNLKNYVPKTHVQTCLSCRLAANQGSMNAGRLVRTILLREEDKERKEQTPQLLERGRPTALEMFQEPNMALITWAVKTVCSEADLLGGGG